MLRRRSLTAAGGGGLWQHHSHPQILALIILSSPASFRATEQHVVQSSHPSMWQILPVISILQIGKLRLKNGKSISKDTHAVGGKVGICTPHLPLQRLLWAPTSAGANDGEVGPSQSASQQAFPKHLVCTRH